MSSEQRVKTYASFVSLALQVLTHLFPRILFLTLENIRKSYSFQKVQKGCIGNKWVNSLYQKPRQFSLFVKNSIPEFFIFHILNSTSNKQLLWKRSFNVNAPGTVQALSDTSCSIFRSYPYHQPFKDTSANFFRDSISKYFGKLHINCRDRN